ncbi:DUF6894 family protein [Sphingosinicella terrae]|uniref:DUF6894 family protein n=1 Tax=Sphingosinicella terrae TaxID=2172047 RepID=UPI000E0D1BC4|nr:hypothetical protein [Sphingosinicella terrae]
MPHFFFDLHNGLGLVSNEEGRELPDLETARREAIKGIRSIISAEVEKGELDLTGRLVVRDGDGAETLVIPFHESLTIVGRWTAPAA